MADFFKLMLSGFWQFVGGMCILSLILHYGANLILQIVHKSIRQKTIMKQGYPPPHCDGDGDFKPKSKEP